MRRLVSARRKRFSDALKRFAYRRAGLQPLEDRRVLASLVDSSIIHQSWAEVTNSAFVAEFLNEPLSQQGASLSFDDVDTSFTQWNSVNPSPQFSTPDGFTPSVHFNIGFVGEVDVVPVLDMGILEAQLFSGYTLTRHLGTPDAGDDYWEISRGNVLDVGPAQLAFEYFATFDSLSDYTLRDEIGFGLRIAVSGEIEFADIPRLLGFEFTAAMGSNFVTVEAATSLSIEQFLSAEFTDQPTLGKGLADIFVPYLGEGLTQNPLYAASRFLPIVNAASFAGINPLDAFVGDTPLGLLAKKGLSNEVSIRIYDGDYLAVDAGAVVGATTPVASAGILLNVGAQVESAPSILYETTPQLWAFGEAPLLSQQEVASKLPSSEQLSGATIVVHGFQASGNGGGDALEPISNAILKRTNGWLVDYDVLDSGRGSGFSNPRRYERTASGNELVLQYDWSTESNNDSSGWAEAAGDRLFAMLVEFDLVDPATGHAKAPLHFIAHSFGAGVVSEAVERLAAYSIPVDHVTFLDPHDFDQALLPVDGSQQIDLLGLPAGYGATRWENVLNMDAYYQTRGRGVVDFSVPNGRPIPGAFNVWLQDGHHLPDDDKFLPGDNLGQPYLGLGRWSIGGDHSFAWNGFYVGTILGEAPDGPKPQNFASWNSTGYAFSRVGQDSTTANVPPPVFFNESSIHPQDHRHSESILVDPTTGLPNNAGINSLNLVAEDITQASWTPVIDRFSIFNGDLSHHRSGEIFSPTAAPGWSYQGGGGTGVIDLMNDASGQQVESLSLQRGFESRTHNDVYIPDDAQSLEFQAWIPFSSPSDALVVELGNIELASLALTTVTGDFEHFAIFIPEPLRGTVNTISFRIADLFDEIESRVVVDAIAFSPHPVPPPVADPGGPYQIEEGGTVVLAGSQVAGNLGNTSNVEYWWDLDGDGVFGETSALAERGRERGPNPLLYTKPTDDGPDSFQVQLRIIENGIGSEPAGAIVTLLNAPPTVSTSGPSHVSINQTATYHASAFDASQADREALDPRHWVWTARSPTETFSANGGSFSFTPQASGKFDVSVTVRDKDNATTTATQVVNLPFADALQHQLDRRIDGELVAGESADLYVLSGLAGQTVSLAAYFGYTPSNRYEGLGINRSGRVRLIDSAGTVLSAPTNAETRFVAGSQSSVRTHYHVWAQLEDFVLPADGTYYVEVSGGVGQYWLGIGDPQLDPQPIAVEEAYLGEFGTQGDSQEFRFRGIAGQSYGWVYEGRPIQDWEIYDASNHIVATGPGGATTTIAFVPAVSGEYQLRLKDHRSTINSARQVGPFTYSLEAAIPNQLDQRIDGNLLQPNDADLYALTGTAGQTVSLAAYFGYTPSNRYEGLGIHRSGRVRLIDSAGTVLSAPTNAETRFVAGSQSSVRTHYHVWAQLEDFVLPADGTYYVEVSGGVGQYWLGIGDPQLDPQPIAVEEAYLGEFGTQGDSQEFRFRGIAGQSYGWVYEGRPIQDWEIYDSSNHVVASGPGGATTSIAFTPLTTGSYQLRFQDQRTAIHRAGDIGPFSFSLSPTDVTAPHSSIVSATFQPATQKIEIELNAADLVGINGAAPSGLLSTDIFVSVDEGDFVHWATIAAPATTAVFTPSSNHVYWFYSVASDHANNVERKPVRPEANVAVGDLDAPTSSVISASPQPSGLIQLDLEAIDLGGGTVSGLEVFVSVDGGAYSSLGTVVPQSVGEDAPQAASLNYQGIVDGAEHAYRFYSVGQDAAGNTETVPPNADVALTESFAVAALELTGINVQSGQAQRSFVRTVDLTFNDTAGLQELIDQGRIRIERFALNDSVAAPGTGSLVSPASLTVSGNQIRVDFGAQGIGGNLRSSAGDGFYRVYVDSDSNGQFDEPSLHFHRILGDTDGNGTVNALDMILTMQNFGRSGEGIAGDVDGDGLVNIIDRILLFRQISKHIDGALLEILDD